MYYVCSIPGDFLVFKTVQQRTEKSLTVCGTLWQSVAVLGSLCKSLEVLARYDAGMGTHFLGQGP